MIDLCCTSV